MNHITAQHLQVSVLCEMLVGASRTNGATLSKKASQTWTRHYELYSTQLCEHVAIVATKQHSILSKVYQDIPCACGCW